MELSSQNFNLDDYQKPEKDNSASTIDERGAATRSVAFAMNDSESNDANPSESKPNDIEPRELLLSGLAHAQQRVDDHLRSLLHSQVEADSLLKQGMRASLLEGGKRVRPFLLFASAQLAKALAQESPKKIKTAKIETAEAKTASNKTRVEEEAARGCSGQVFAQLGIGSRLADDAAAALELVHSYSLVHDDLPSMDGDLLRRGKPTMHVRFGEGQAILVGDALLTLAFEVLATVPPATPSGTFSGVDSSSESILRLALIKRLAVAAGIGGMVGGQSLDLAYVDGSAENIASGDDFVGKDNCAEVRSIHARKTGALLRAACAMGACCEGANDGLCAALEVYGRAIGEAYQIVDDLCDFADASSQPSAPPNLSSASSASPPIGKPASPSHSCSQPCYVRAVGKSAAEERARTLCLGAEASIAGFGDAALPLVLFARFLPSRIPSRIE